MNILFLGGDKRYLFMMDELSRKHSIYQIGFNIKNSKIKVENITTLNFSKFDIVIFPISGLTENLEIKSDMRFITIAERNLFKHTFSCYLFYWIKN